MDRDGPKDPKIRLHELTRQLPMLLLRYVALNREGNLAVQVRLPEHGEPLGDPQLGGRREVGRRRRRRRWRRRFAGGNAVAEEIGVGGQLAAGQPQAEAEEGERRRHGHADDAEADQGRVASQHCAG